MWKARLVGTSRLLAVVLISVLLVLHADRGTALAAEPLRIFAAASLRNALDKVMVAWAAEGHGQAVATYAGTPALARQIDAGAPADIFFSANIDWMEWLASRKGIRPGTRTDLLINRLVLIAPRESSITLEIGRGFPLAAALGSGRLAMADTRSVPAGLYGRTALEKLGVWDSVAARVAQSENVRAALVFVARGEAPLGIVYATDARSEPRVRVVGTFPADTHPPIVYPVAVTTSAGHPDAIRFLEFLRSPAARSAFEAEGFVTVEPH